MDASNLPPPSDIPSFTYSNKRIPSRFRSHRYVKLSGSEDSPEFEVFSKVPKGKSGYAPIHLTKSGGKTHKTYFVLETTLNAMRTGVAAAQSGAVPPPRLAPFPKMGTSGDTDESQSVSPPSSPDLPPPTLVATPVPPPPTLVATPVPPPPLQQAPSVRELVLMDFKTISVISTGYILDPNDPHAHEMILRWAESNYSGHELSSVRDAILTSLISSIISPVVASAPPLDYTDLLNLPFPKLCTTLVGQELDPDKAESLQKLIAQARTQFSGKELTYLIRAITIITNAASTSPKPTPTFDGPLPSSVQEVVNFTLSQFCERFLMDATRQPDHDTIRDLSHAIDREFIHEHAKIVKRAMLIAAKRVTGTSELPPLLDETSRSPPFTPESAVSTPTGDSPPPFALETIDLTVDSLSTLSELSMMDQLRALDLALKSATVESIGLHYPNPSLIKIKTLLLNMIPTTSPKMQELWDRVATLTQFLSIKIQKENRFINSFWRLKDFSYPFPISDLYLFLNKPPTVDLAEILETVKRHIPLSEAGEIGITRAFNAYREFKELRGQALSRDNQAAIHALANTYYLTPSERGEMRRIEAPPVAGAKEQASLLLSTPGIGFETLYSVLFQGEATPPSGALEKVESEVERLFPDSVEQGEVREQVSAYYQTHLAAARALFQAVFNSEGISFETLYLTMFKRPVPESGAKEFVLARVVEIYGDSENLDQIFDRITALFNSYQLRQPGVS